MLCSHGGGLGGSAGGAGTANGGATAESLSSGCGVAAGSPPPAGNLRGRAMSMICFITFFTSSSLVSSFRTSLRFSASAAAFSSSMEGMALFISGQRKRCPALRPSLWAGQIDVTLKAKPATENHAIVQNVLQRTLVITDIAAALADSRHTPPRCWWVHGVLASAYCCAFITPAWRA